MHRRVNELCLSVYMHICMHVDTNYVHGTTGRGDEAHTHMHPYIHTNRQKTYIHTHRQTQNSGVHIHVMASRGDETHIKISRVTTKVVPATTIQLHSGLYRQHACSAAPTPDGVLDPLSGGLPDLVECV